MARKDLTPFFIYLGKKQDLTPIYLLAGIE